MDDDSCVLKYIEIVPLDNSAEHFEELKPFQVKVLFPVNFLYVINISEEFASVSCELNQQSFSLVLM